MRVLLDHCVPKRIGRLLEGHEARHTSTMGWDELNNGRLLAAASDAGFDVLLTVDRSMERQQNLAKLPLPIVVLRVSANSERGIRPVLPALLAVLGQRLENRVYTVAQPGRAGTR